MIRSVLSHFPLPGAFVGAGRFGSGLINETYLCEFSAPGGVGKYILQKINAAVFSRPERVMQNVELVTEHIQARLRAEGVADPENCTPALVRTRNGATCHVDGNGAYWRMFHFIETGEVFDHIRDTRRAHEIGRGLGRFQALVSDLSPGRLHDTLPGFHHTPLYLGRFEETAATGMQERIAQAGREIAFVQTRRNLAGMLMDAVNSGKVPLRVVHNDPKVNNVLLHRETGAAICMVDLDTVKPGATLFDVGDCVRSAANPAGEDPADITSVMYDRELAEAVIGGYRQETDAFLTKAEVELLPVSIKVITFELGVRFLTDYLLGDAYFRVTRPDHNLHRARVQFRLLEQMEGTLVT